MGEYGYRTISVTPQLWDKLESFRKELGLRSVAETVGYLATEYPLFRARLEELKAARAKIQSLEAGLAQAESLLEKSRRRKVEQAMEAR